MRYGLKIPKLLSLLADRDPNGVVTGLDAFPPDRRPDPRLVHPFFDLMVGGFFLMALAAGWFWWRRWRSGAFPGERKILAAVLVASPFGMIALESGWLVTEFGRQPWVVMDHMRVAQGATPAPGISVVFYLFLGVYLLLTVGLLKTLLRRPADAGREEGDDDHA